MVSTVDPCVRGILQRRGDINRHDSPSFAPQMSHASFYPLITLKKNDIESEKAVFQYYYHEESTIIQLPLYADFLATKSSSSDRAARAVIQSMSPVPESSSGHDKRDMVSDEDHDRTVELVFVF